MWIPEWFVWMMLTMAGLSLGSFISAASYRIPRGEDMVRARSRCTRCQTTLDVKSLIPLFSWLWYRAKCRFCRAPVSWRYPLTEILACLILFISCALYAPQWVEAGLVAAIGLTLLCLAIIDLEHRILPDKLQFILAALVGGLVFLSGVETLAWHALAGGVLFLFGAGLHYGYPLIRGREGLGWGDVKFFAVSGLLLGFAPLPLFLFLSGIGGIVTGVLWKCYRKDPLFPFGPALCVALWGSYLLWYRSALGNFFSGLLYLY